MPRITVIPATVNLHTHLPKCEKHRRRAAAYARVSTEQDEQTSSYEAQVDYYSKLIKGNPEWEYVNVYTDEGISGTNTKKRKGFNEMVADALDGKIDLILTKSVSRFARNTVDSLVTIRKLKEKGVEVYFEKENIYSMDGKGELLLTIMSSKHFITEVLAEEIEFVESQQQAAPEQNTQAEAPAQAAPTGELPFEI